MTEKTARERLKKQYDRINDYQKNNYDRIVVLSPKGTKDQIKAAADRNGETVSGLINRLIIDYLEKQWYYLIN